MPVVFWLHGGAFIFGSELTPLIYHPRTFTDRGVIYVSINYRYGPLGAYRFLLKRVYGTLKV